MMDSLRRIIYFLDFPFSVGGSNKVLLTQAYLMKQRGYQVKVVIPNDDKGKHAQEYDKICSGFALENSSAYYKVAVCLEEIDILSALDESETFLEILNEYKPDLIHSTQLNIALEMASRDLHIPHLMNIYQADRQEFNLNWMKVYPQYHSADSVLMSEYWRTGLKIASKCVRIAYSEKEKNKDIKDERDGVISILSIGTLCERKNQMECLKFVSICKKNGYQVKLTVLGHDTTEYGKKCKKYVEENSLQNNVEFLGFVFNVEYYLNNTDVLFMVSRVESYPGVIVESMANRLPVIATPVAGVTELMKNKENGFLSEGYEAPDLYQVFLDYLSFKKSGQILQLVENAYRTYLEKHTYEVVGLELESYYHWIFNDYFNKNIVLCKASEIKKKMKEFIFQRKIDLKYLDSGKLWFLYHILPYMEQKRDKTTMIWGAGFWGKVFYEWLNLLSSNIAFIGFIDSNKEGNYLGFPVVNSRHEWVNSCGTIIVSVIDEKSRLEIMNFLDKRGKERNKDYFLMWNGPIRI